MRAFIGLIEEKRFISPVPWGKPCHSLNHAAVRHDLPKISIETYFWYCFSGQPIACFNANPRGVGRRRHDKCCRRSSGHRSLVNRSYTLRYGLSCFPARGRRACGGAARGCVLGVPCWRYLARFWGRGHWPRSKKVRLGHPLSKPFSGTHPGHLSGGGL